MATLEARIKGSGDYISVFRLNKDCGMGLVGFGTLQLWLGSGQPLPQPWLCRIFCGIIILRQGSLVERGLLSAAVLILIALHDPFPEAWFLLVNVTASVGRSLISVPCGPKGAGSAF